VYRAARLNLLHALDVPNSNRDPLAEFSERFVAALLGGELPPNRVQRGWDVALGDGSKVQVRYLANPAGPRWVNEHVVYRIPGVDYYALVIIEDFAVAGVVVFPCQQLGPVASALGKRHADMENTVQFTCANWRSICADADRYRSLGVQVYVPEDFGTVVPTA